MIDIIAGSLLVLALCWGAERIMIGIRSRYSVPRVLRPNGLLVRTGVAVVVLWGLHQLASARHFQLAGRLITRVETGEKIVALTFDDGPTSAYGDSVLRVLNRYGVKGTFFLIGKEMAAHRSVTRQIIDEGHQIGNHSFSHRLMLGQSLGAVRDEVERTDRLIRELGYRGEIYFRPPYGKRFLALPYHLWRTGRTTVYMDVEPESDPTVAANAELIVQKTLSAVRPGSIVLLHAMYRSREPTRRALPAIIDSLHARGYELVTLDELLAAERRSPSDPRRRIRRRESNASP
jgi:peptidoglycan/xylan/chitin deacetylase (PgdA/CDA1 family)